MTDLVKCNRAWELSGCKGCPHASPHRRETFGGRWMGGTEYCTEWRECWGHVFGTLEATTVIKVRCGRVKPWTT